jgi:hypothetical protein
MVIPNENPSDLIGTMKGVDTGLVDGDEKITLSSASTITTTPPVPIKETTLFVEHILTSYDDGMTAHRQFDATGTYDIYDVFNTFDPTNKKTINSFNKEVNLIGVTPETKTAVGGGNGLSEYTSFQSWCNYINSTEEASGSEKTVYDVFWEFALTESNGDYDENAFNTFITSKLESSGSIASSYSQKNDYAVNLKAAWDKLPKKQKANVNFAEKAIFNNIGIPVTYPELKADNPTFSFSIDFEIKFPGGYGDKEYDDLSDPDNQLTFWVDYRFMCDSIKIAQGSLIKDKTKAATTEKLSIKFLGTYKPNISFFTTKHGAQTDVYGGIKWSPLTLNNYYTLTSTTEADSVPSKSGIDTNKQNSYISKIVGVIDEEYKLWESSALKEDCKNPIVIAALTKYWIAARSSIANFPCGGDDSPWSAAFISFIMQKSGVEFPFSINHNTYILKGRDDKNYAWQAYDVSDPNATVRVGDLVCNTRSKSINKTLSEITGGDLTHCDCVKEATTLKASVYGGNLGQTVLNRELKLIEGSGLIDPSNNKGDGSRVSDLKYICVIKYQPKGVNGASSIGANNFDPNATGAFTAIQKYPALFEKVLSHESHTYDDHNYYTHPKVLHSYFADGKNTRYTGLAKPLSQYTIGEVIQFQSHAQDSVGRLHATGRYQIIGSTLRGNLKEAGLTNSDLYSPENQDKLGMALLQSNTIKYLNKQVDDTQDNLNKAAMEIARTWSSVGVPHPTTWVDDEGNVHNVAFDQSYYGGNGVDRANTKTADVQAALKYYRNGSVAPIAATANSKTVVIGDSLAKGIDPIYPAISRISSPKELDTVGWGISQLTTALKGTTTTFPDVKNLILTIGANNGWNLSGGNAKEIELIGLIQQKFPKAALYIINGNYGWGSLVVTGTNTEPYWTNKINNYINVYKNKGFTVVGNVSLCTVHPGKGDTLFTSLNSTLSNLA